MVFDLRDLFGLFGPLGPLLGLIALLLLFEKKKKKTPPHRKVTTTRITAQRPPGTLARLLMAEGVEETAEGGGEWSAEGTCTSVRKVMVGIYSMMRMLLDEKHLGPWGKDPLPSRFVPAEYVLFTS